MRLENLLALTHGKLVNEPFVNSFSNIIFDARLVKRGDLFIAFDETTIEEAIFNGAYGILFDKPTQISDSEIAWIKVDDLDEALKRLLRFRLIENEIQVFSSNEIVLKLALQVITETNFLAINGDLQSIAGALWNLEKGCTLLFSPTISDEKIFADAKELPKVGMSSINVIEQTLFETSFIYDDIFYERQQISPFFIPYLEELLHFFKTFKINYRLRRFTPIDHFEAVFTNKNFEEKEFGTSDKVLIFEKNTSLIEREISFLQDNASWAQIIYLVPNKAKEGFLNQENMFGYNSQQDIIKILDQSHFHFALIVGVDKSILKKVIPNQKQLTLDF